MRVSVTIQILREELRQKIIEKLSISIHVVIFEFFIYRLILSTETDESRIKETMNKDMTLCCQRSKRMNKPQSDEKQIVKRRASTSSSARSTQKPKRTKDHSDNLPSSNQQKASKHSHEIVCTPDLYIEPVADGSVRVKPASAPTIPSTSSATTQTLPRPLAIRQLTSPIQTVLFQNRQNPTVPCYYPVSGYQVDLNAAARQNGYRLPNGKIIQVKKTSANISTNRNPLPPQPRSISTNLNTIRFNIQPSPNAIPQQAPSQPTLVQHQVRQQILHGINNAPTVPTTTVNTTIVLQSQHQYPKTPLGQAQAELEKQIIATQRFCQQIVWKCNKLMNSNAYKSVRNYNDIKELHLHLSYLLTYAIDKLTTLKTVFTSEMNSLTQVHEAALADKKNRYTNVDDDVQVVEPQPICIEIDSDDENKSTETGPDTDVGETTAEALQPSQRINVFQEVERKLKAMLEKKRWENGAVSPGNHALNETLNESVSQVKDDNESEITSLTKSHEPAETNQTIDDDVEMIEPTSVCIAVYSDDENESKKSTAETHVDEITSKALEPRSDQHYSQPTTEIVNTIRVDELELPTIDLDSDGCYQEYDDNLHNSLEGNEEIVQLLNEILKDKNSESGVERESSVAETVNKTMDQIYNAVEVQQLEHKGYDLTNGQSNGEATTVDCSNGFEQAGW